MKILCVIPSLVKGGAERVLSVLSLEWSTENEVTIMTFNEKSKSYKIGGKEICLDIPTSKNIFVKFYNVIKRIALLVKHINKENPDRIISFMETANIPTFFATLFTRNRKKHVVSIHNNPNKFPLVYRKSIKHLYKHTRMIVTVSEGIKKEVTGKKYKIDSYKVKSIPNPIDYNEIQKLKNQKEINLWEQNLPTFIAMGRLHKQKGFDYLIQAFKNVNNLIQSQLIILGEGSERTKLESLVASCNLENYVFMPGVVNNPFYYLHKADIFVLSSRYEGWGNVIVEALASGVPVISFNCNFGPSEILKDKYGILIENHNIEKLAYSMITLISDMHQREEMTIQGLIRAKDFDVKKVADEWLT